MVKKVIPNIGFQEDIPHTLISSNMHIISPKVYLIRPVLYFSSRTLAESLFQEIYGQSVKMT